MIVEVVGLPLMWNEEINFSVLSYSKSHIDALIANDDANKTEWYLTGVYGYPNTACRIETSNLIRFLCRLDEKSWLVFCDFNEILGLYEKWGGRDRREKQMIEFRVVLNDCDLRDLGFVGTHILGAIEGKGHPASVRG